MRLRPPSYYCAMLCVVLTTANTFGYGNSSYWERFREGAGSQVDLELHCDEISSSCSSELHNVVREHGDVIEENQEFLPEYLSEENGDTPKHDNRNSSSCCVHCDHKNCEHMPGLLMQFKKMRFLIRLLPSRYWKKNRNQCKSCTYERPDTIFISPRRRSSSPKETCSRQTSSRRESKQQVLAAGTRKSIIGGIFACRLPKSTSVVKDEEKAALAKRSRAHLDQIYRDGKEKPLANRKKKTSRMCGIFSSQSKCKKSMAMGNKAKPCVKLNKKKQTLDQKSSAKKEVVSVEENTQKECYFIGSRKSVREALTNQAEQNNQEGSKEVAGCIYYDAAKVQQARVLRKQKQGMVRVASYQGAAEPRSKEMTKEGRSFSTSQSEAKEVNHAIAMNSESQKKACSSESADWPCPSCVAKKRAHSGISMCTMLVTVAAMIVSGIIIVGASNGPVESQNPTPRN